jgi:hypothetical protein
MWFQVELPQPATIAEVQFDAGAPGGRGVGGRGGQRGQGPPAGRGAAPPAAGAAGTTPPPPAAAAQPRAGRGTPPPVFGSFPLGYRVQVSIDGKTWSAPVAEGTGSPATTVATFRPVQARFIRVTQTASGENALPWSVLNFRVYAVGK